MSRASSLGVSLLLCTGCASSPPPSPEPAVVTPAIDQLAPPLASLPEQPGEQGLAGLRAALGIDAARGRVERSADGAWLVHGETGVRMVRVPPIGGACSTPSGGALVPFEGEPGAVLELGNGQATLFQYDATEACAVATADVFATARPTMTEVLALSPSDSPKAQRKGHIDVAGVPDGVDVALTATGFEVRRGKTVLHREAFPGERSRCAVTSSIAVGETDGKTVLHVQRTAVLAPDGATCKALETTPYTPDEITATRDVWLELGADRPVRVLAASTMPTLYSPTPSESMFVVDLPMGELRFASDGKVVSGREGTLRVFDWSWSVASPNEPPVTFAKGSGL